MDITKYGHSCLHVTDNDASILLDPGSFSSGFSELTGLTAILITHVHADHLDVPRIASLLSTNPDATVYAEPAAVAELAAAGVAATAVAAGERLDVGTEVTVHGQQHAVIHADLPLFGNTGFLVGGRLFHPGDSLELPEVAVEILAVPVMAPWMAMKEAIDFQRAVAPSTSIPIHDHLLANTGLYYDRLANMGPADLTWLNIDDGRTVHL